MTLSEWACLVSGQTLQRLLSSDDMQPLTEDQEIQINAQIMDVIHELWGCAPNQGSNDGT